jgi:hypothetical protein
MEKEYINYLIENKNVELVSSLLDSYFLDQIDFEELTDFICSVNDVLTYRSFVKSKKIDDLLG